MAVEKVGEKYKCNVCGNEVVVTKVGGGVLVCCGQDMKKIELETPEVINLLDAEGEQDYLDIDYKCNKVATVDLDQR